MFQQLARWLVRLITEWLDPQYKAELTAYYAERDDQLIKIQLVMAEIAAVEQRIREIGVERESVKAELALSILRLDDLEKKRNEAIHQEQKALAGLAGKSDADVLRADM